MAILNAQLFYALTQHAGDTPLDDFIKHYIVTWKITELISQTIQ